MVEYKPPFKHDVERVRVGNTVERTKVTRDATGKFVSKGNFDFAITWLNNE